MGGKHETKKNESKKSRQKASRGGHASSLWKSLESQIERMGLRIKQITGDGNCFFRSISDQLYGHENEHRAIRKVIVGHMDENKDEYSLFVEDDEPWSDYIGRMRKDGTWAGQIEVIVASKIFCMTINIHQPSLPIWIISCDSPQTKSIHLAFEDDHYNSVRMTDDYSDSAPAPIVPNLGAAGPDESSASSADALIRRGLWGEEEEKAVSQATGCREKDLVQKMLAASRGNVDGAIEALIEHLSSRLEEEEELKGEEIKKEEEEVKDEPVDLKKEEDSQDRSKGKKESKSSSRIEKKLKKGKMSLGDVRCSCGSGKKTKNCCGRKEEADQVSSERKNGVEALSLKTLIL